MTSLHSLLDGLVALPPGVDGFVALPADNDNDKINKDEMNCALPAVSLDGAAQWLI